MQEGKTHFHIFILGFCVILSLLVFFYQTGQSGALGNRGPRGEQGPTGPIADVALVTEVEATGASGIAGLMGPTGANGQDSNLYTLDGISLSMVPYTSTGSVQSTLLTSGQNGTFSLQFNVPELPPFIPVASAQSGPTTSGFIVPSGPAYKFDFQFSVGVSGLQGATGPQGASGANGLNSLGPTGLQGVTGPPAVSPSSGPNANACFAVSRIAFAGQETTITIPTSSGPTGPYLMNHFFFTLVGGGGAGAVSGPGGGGGSGTRMYGYAAVKPAATGPTTMTAKVGGGGIASEFAYPGASTYIDFVPHPTDCAYGTVANSSMIRLCANGGEPGIRYFGGNGYGGGGGASGSSIFTLSEESSTWSLAIGGFGGRMNGFGPANENSGGYGAFYDPAAMPAVNPVSCGTGGGPHGSYVLASGTTFTSVAAKFGGGGHGAYYNGANLVKASNGADGFLELYFF